MWCLFVLGSVHVLFMSSRMCICNDYLCTLRAHLSLCAAQQHCPPTSLIITGPSHGAGGGPPPGRPPARAAVCGLERRYRVCLECRGWLAAAGAALCALLGHHTAAGGVGIWYGRAATMFAHENCCQRGTKKGTTHYTHNETTMTCGHK